MAENRKEEKMSAATLKKLAELTGVSIRSVNRALHGDLGLSEDKRRKILETAARIGYTPNIAARNLRLKQNNFVGIIIPDFNQKTGISNTIASRKINELQLKLEHDGYFTLVGICTTRTEELENLLKQWTGLVSTVIFFFWNPRWSGQKMLDKLPLQFIFVDRNMDFGHCLQIDRSAGIYDGIRFLLERGCTRLARCGSIPSRDAGFNAALGDFPERSIVHCHYRTGNDFEDGYAIGTELIREHYDAVFFDTDRMAFGFLKYCWKNRIRIPEDIAVIGFDDEHWDLCSCPSLSTVAHPTDEMVEVIAELVRHPEMQPRRQFFKTRFIRRESV